MRGKRIVDLSHIMMPGKEEYGLALETLETAAVYPQYKVREDTWYILQNIAMGSHCGTHIEFPYHHNSQGFDAATFPFERLVGPCVLLDFQHKQANEPVTLAELHAYDELIQVGDGVLFNFDCAKKYGTPLGHERPFLEYEATEWLVHQKRINVLGSDASGVEIKGAVGQPIHELVMKHQIPIIEFAANLNALQARRFTLLTLAMPIKGLDASPLRLVAIEDLD